MLTLTEKELNDSIRTFKDFIRRCENELSSLEQRGETSGSQRYDGLEETLEDARDALENLYEFRVRPYSELLDKWTNEDGIEFTLEAVEEDIPIRGNAIASGDDEADAKLEAEIIESYENGNLFAWCSLHVVASHPLLTELYGHNYLGCVSLLPQYITNRNSITDEAKGMATDHGMAEEAKGELISHIGNTTLRLKGIPFSLGGMAKD